MKQRHHSLPDCIGNDQLDEKELQRLTEMLQMVIDSNPSLEKNLKALNI